MLHFGRTFQHIPSIYVTKKATIQTLFLTLYRGFLHGRSGETRTRGLLLPKQARYQLRNTPEKYYHSILFFAAFVNPEVRNFTLPLFVHIFIRKSGCKGRKEWSIMGVEKRPGAVRLPK